jgi:hypothetical protein
MLLAIAGAFAIALPAAGSSTHDFKAEFQEDNGVVVGYGTVTTTLTITSAEPRPDGCLSATAERLVILDKDPSSTLSLALEGFICDPKVGGTWKIVSGTGVFAAATGSGSISGVLNRVGDIVHYRGTISFL